MEHGVWQDPHYLKLWMYCIMKASHTEREQLVGNQLVKINRGEFVTGRFSLTDEMNRGMKPEQQKNDVTWWRYLKNLEKWGMLHIKSNNKFSVVTLDKYDFYQQVKGKGEQQTAQQLHNNCTTDAQQLHTNKELNNDKELNNVNKKKSNSRKRAYDESSIDYQLSNFLYERILENNPNHKKPNLQEWANSIRLMRERDKRTEEQIRYVIEWAQNDSFWAPNILSTKKLREKFDTLTGQIKARKNKVAYMKPKESMFAQSEESRKRQQAAEESVTEETLAEIQKTLEELPY